MTDTKLNINTGAADIFNNGWKHQQNSEVVENNSAEKMMYKLMFLLVRVAMAVCFDFGEFLHYGYTARFGRRRVWQRGQKQDAC